MADQHFTRLTYRKPLDRDPVRAFLHAGVTRYGYGYVPDANGAPDALEDRKTYLARFKDLCCALGLEIWGPKWRHQWAALAQVDLPKHIDYAIGSAGGPGVKRATSARAGRHLLIAAHNYLLGVRSHIDDLERQIFVLLQMSHDPRICSGALLKVHTDPKRAEKQLKEGARRRRNDHRAATIDAIMRGKPRPDRRHVVVLPARVLERIETALDPSEVGKLEKERVTPKGEKWHQANRRRRRTVAKLERLDRKLGPFGSRNDENPT